MITDRDPGDECDADGAIARTIARLRAWFIEHVPTRDFGAERALPGWVDESGRRFVHLEPHIEIHGTIGGREHHDPGDEQDRITVVLRRGGWFEVR